MQIYHTTNAVDAVRISEECLAGHEGLIVHIADVVFVETGQLDTLNIDECDNLGIYVGTARYLGGSIVCMPGDLSLCMITWGNSDFAPKTVQLIAQWLRDRGLNISMDENDVLADEKKVISWARSTTYDGWCQSVVHFSIGPMDLEMVKAICTKPMVKVPGALSEYGITAEMIWDEIQRRGLLES